MGLYKGESYSEDEWKDKNINSATGKPFGQAGEEAVQGKAQDWANQGLPVPGTTAPEDNRSLAGQLFDWAKTPAGNAVIGGLGLAGLAAAGTGIKDRMRSQGANQPRVEPYAAPSYDYETTAREVPERLGLPQPSTPTGPTAPTAPEPTPPGPAPKVAPTGVPVPQPYQGAGLQQPQMTYGQTNLTGAIEGVPNPLAPAAPPAGTPTKPIDPVQQARVDAINAETQRKQAAHVAEQLRKQQLHEATLAKKSAVNLQKTQGKPVSDAEMTMIKKSEEAKLDKQVYANQAAANKPKPEITPPAAPVTPSPVAAAAAQQAENAVDEVAKSSAVEKFSRDSKGNIKWPEKMSPAAKAGAEAFAKQFPQQASILEKEGRFGILGAGAGDNNLYNSYGPDLMKTLRNEVNQGQMVGTYSNYEKKVNPAIQAISPETATGKQLAELRATQPKGGNKGVLGTPAAVNEKGELLIGKNSVPKALKAGAAATLLMSFANAGNARELANAVGESLLPLALTPSSLANGELTPEILAAQERQMKEMQKLGSPYRSVPPPKR